MSTLLKLLRLISSGLLFMSLLNSASAQWGTEDIDDVDNEDRLPGNAKAQDQESDSPLVEVARGLYIQADPGVIDYLGLISQGPEYLYNFGQVLYWGPSLRLHGGMDMVVRDSFALSAEVTFWQMINSGAPYDPGQQAIAAAQGDTRSFLLEAAVRPALLLGRARRINLFLRAGGGVGFLAQALSQVPEPGIYSSMAYGISPRPFVTGGLGLEYYTRLSHFSFTFAEVNAVYLLGLDVALGINFGGMKYTF